MIKQKENKSLQQGESLWPPEGSNHFYYLYSWFCLSVSCLIFYCVQQDDRVQTTHMMDGQHQKGPATGALGHHGDEAGIGWAVVVVVDAVCDWHPVVAVLLGGRLPVDVAKLRAAERRTPRHLEEVFKVYWQFIMNKISTDNLYRKKEMMKTRRVENVWQAYVISQ